MGKGPLPSREALRALLSDRHDVDATLDLGKAQRVGGVFWLIGGALALVMLPFAPPTEAIGWPGWAISALCVGICFAIAARRFHPRVIPSVDEIFLSGWLGLAAIVALEWLAGGRSSPYDQLLFLPATYAAAVHGGWRVAGFLTAVLLAACLPLLYDDVSHAETVRLGTQVLLLLALALTARILILTLRVQRGKLMRAGQEAESLARRDSLTGLGNRRAFQEALTREVARARRADGSLSVLLGDVKSFKAINDSLGHTRGDECLKVVARRLTEAARLSEECFRWGGDEFAILLPSASERDAALVRDRVCGDMGDECGAQLTLICAVASLSEGDTPDDLLREVDRVLVGLKGQHARPPRINRRGRPARRSGAP